MEPLQYLNLLNHLMLEQRPQKKNALDNARRVGDLSQSGDEKVVGYEWNVGKTECITLWEPVTVVEKFLPAANVVSTTATIAVVATTSALLANLLLIFF